MLFFCLFQCFEGKEYQSESKRNETFKNVIFGTNVIQRTWSGRQETTEEATRQGGAPAPWARPHPRWPLVALLTNFVHLYILLYPKNTEGHDETLFPPPTTFSTREIPSWGLFRRSAGGGIDHGGLLHQHHSLSDDV